MASIAMAQEIKTCDMCETSPVKMHCNSCATNLCDGCVGKHVSADIEKDHNLVVFKKKNTKPIFPICKSHKKLNCELKCQQCDTPVCVDCVHSGSHKNHEILSFLKLYNSQKDIIKEKTSQLETLTYPQYEKAISKLEITLKNLPKIYDGLMSAIANQGEEWHREVNIIIKRRKQEVQKMKTDDIATLTKLLEETKNLQSTLLQAIKENNNILQLANVTKVLDSKYTSPEMWNPPQSIDVTPPTFTPLPIQGEQLHEMFGTLTAASMPHPQRSIKTVENKLTKAIKQLQLLDYPESPSSVMTGYKFFPYDITCLNPDEFWVSGYSREIKRFTITGSLQETVYIKTSRPYGITVTRQGDLIYTDFDGRSINRVRHGKIEKIISLQDWQPVTVCCTDSDELLVTMRKSSIPNRVVRYSGSAEKQVIQFDDQGEPLFSSDHSDMFITENQDKDVICVSDGRKKIVVVVNQAGKLRFRYTGNVSSQKYTSFSPRGVVIDSMGHILVVDKDKRCIHIIDLQGHFIRYIDNCQLSQPLSLSLDRKNTLYVAEFQSAKVKVIKYLS